MRREKKYSGADIWTPDFFDDDLWINARKQMHRAKLEAYLEEKRYKEWLDEFISDS